MTGLLLLSGSSLGGTDAFADLTWHLVPGFALTACEVLLSCGRVRVLQLFCGVFSLHKFRMYQKIESLIWSGIMGQVSNQSSKRRTGMTGN